MSRSVNFLLSISLALGLAAPVAAQTADATNATAAELQMLFQRQKSRGLKLAPGTGLSATADPAATLATGVAGSALSPTGGTAVAAVPVAPTGGTSVIASSGATPAPVISAPVVAAAAVAAGADGVLVPVAYTEIDEEDQVNIRIAFDFDSAVLRDSEKPKLAQLCIAMKAVDIDRFRIVGHTDAAGSDAYNDRLSLLRAQEVKRHLVSDCGLPTDRLEAVGVGKRFLTNPDEPRGEENRRVEFQALS